MATTSEGWLQNAKTGPIDPNEKLFVFGYSCKIFRDDEKSAYIDQGKHLIPWMGDKTVMIDRYDVRGYLHDLSQYEPFSGEHEDPVPEEEKLCDEERYRSLRSDMSEEQLYQEEELKRLRAAIAGDGAYHEIAFSYDNAEDEKYVEPEQPKDIFLKKLNDPPVEESEDEPYQMPEGLDVPKGMEVPFTMKIHAIIEKTAIFVSEQGGQMEIIIKMKQHANPQFAFMHLDNPLYPYYKHLVKQIKAGSYKPVQKEKVSKSDDEDDDDHYLHPSLMAGRQEPVPKFTVPNINFRRSSDDSYSVLVRNLQQHRAAEEAANSPSQNSPESQTQDSSDQVSKPSVAIPEVQVPPPPDIQPIIDKMAEYVVKNGEDFETIVKAKNDHRFDFLHSWHEHHNYYIYKRNSLRIELFGNGIEARPIVQESGPVLYSSKNSSTVSHPPQPKAKVPKPPRPPKAPKREMESMHSQDSQSSLPDFPTVRTHNEGSSDSFGYDSPYISENSVETKKPLKGLKGPISFSLKADQPTEKAKLTPLLLGGDSEEENGEEGEDKKRSNDDRYSPEPVKANAFETKPSKPHNEELEAKQAEERIRDKLLGTVRERLAQQRKEKQLIMEAQKREEQLVKDKLRQLEQSRKDKQLQLERKRKAELFLKMLKRKDSDSIMPHILEKSGASGNPFNNKHKRGKSSDSSEQSGEEEPISVYGEKPSSDPEMFGPHEKPEEVVKEDPKKKKARRRSRSKDRSLKPKSSRHERKRQRSRSKSRSPSKRHEKPKKELPAAYALNTRSRSRSRSPRRYRPSFNSWHRRR